jgi:hypothetical protein
VRVRDIVVNPAYKGQALGWRWHRERLRGGKHRLRLRPEDETIPLPESTVPALVDAELWDAANAQLVSNRTEACRRNASAEAWLLRAGLVRCAACGRALSMKHTNPALGRPARYVCRSSIPRPDRCREWSVDSAWLDEQVWVRVMDALLDDAWVEMQTRMTVVEEQQTANLSGLDATVAALQKQIDAIAGSIRPDMHPTVMRSLTDQMTGLAKQQDALLLERGRLAAEQADIDARRAALTSIRNRVPAMRQTFAVPWAVAERRALLRGLDADVRVRPGAEGDKDRVVVVIDLGRVANIENGTSSRLVLNVRLERERGP